MSYQYVACDGNYGDATGMVFLPAEHGIEETGETSYAGELDDEDAYLNHAAQHGTNNVWVLVVDDGSSTEITVWANEADALDAIRVNYIDGDDDAPEDDSENVQWLADHGYIVYLDSHPLPFTR